MKTHRVGVLAFHGDVIEHIRATQLAAKNLKRAVDVIPVRTKADLRELAALIIPGGESTTLHMLAAREGMFEDMKNVSSIFGTCAGAILLARHVLHKAPDQQTLELMDITVDRNAYGRQTESFEKRIHTTLGPISAIFIRAPKIKHVGGDVTVLSRDGQDIIACEQHAQRQFFLACAFHPELTTPIFHEYFLTHALG